MPEISRVRPNTNMTIQEIPVIKIGVIIIDPMIISIIDKIRLNILFTKTPY